MAVIKWHELVKPHHQPDKDVVVNLARLHHVLNFIRYAYDEPMIISSGFRTLDEHQDIYFRLNERRRVLGLPQLKIPMKSMHLVGAAADVYDPNGSLKKWVLEHLELMESLNIYFEDYDFTDSWIHIQIMPPKSLKRFFIP